MSLTTYVNLQAAIASYLARDDLTSYIPDFITLFEAKMNRSLFVRQMETRATTSVDTTDDEPEFITLPSDFQSMRRVRLTGVTGKPTLQYLSGIQLEDVRLRTSDVAAQPCYFTIVNDEMELVPTPDQDYDVEMIYRKNIPALASNSTNWLLTLAPDLYLYGAMLESAAFNKDDERIQIWALGLQTALDALNNLGQVAAFTGPMQVRTMGITP